MYIGSHSDINFAIYCQRASIIGARTDSPLAPISASPRPSVVVFRIRSNLQSRHRQTIRERHNQSTRKLSKLNTLDPYFWLPIERGEAFWIRSRGVPMGAGVKRESGLLGDIYDLIQFGDDEIS